MLEKAYQLRTRDFSEFRKIIKVLKEKEESLDWQSRNKLDYLWAFYLSRTGSTEEAIEYYHKVIENDVELDMSFNSLISLVNLNLLKGETEQAFIYATNFNDEKYAAVDSDLKETAALLVAYTLLKSGLPGEASELVKNIPEQLAQERNECVRNAMLSELYYYQGGLDADYKKIVKKADECKASGEAILGYIAKIYFAKHEILNDRNINALKMMVSELEDVISTKYDNLVAQWYSTLAEVWLDNNSHEHAIRYAELSLGYDVDQSHIESKVLSLLILSKAYFIAEKYDLAYKYMDEYNELMKSSQRNKLTSAVAYYSAQLKAEESARQIESLNKKLSLADLESQVAKVEAENNRLYLSMALIVVCMLILWVYKTKLHQLRLKKQVEVDALTGVLSRRYFSECFEKALVSAQPAQQSVSFVLFDLDHFKRINDSYGHPAGDWVLKAVGEVCSSSGRRADLVGRLGGEEFGILLPDCDMANATRVAEQCRLAIERIDSTPAGAKFQITASFGVSASSVVGYDSRALIVDADKALYLSKKHGRNRVTLSPNYDNSVILGAGI
ncbi:GGDEF domain-containing protein [Corallincola holothuriorum]|uniref:diguanylate cyclase n=1 Tax=Corallincola holothuriorum TaxID=2282215 RepID=A0A368NRZ5_9GAMM|nr:GGDEF domain-containing protein [Corallincola holothuriorum]RCU52880.1 GGDEF domain-containing protein [Corallincola holothuriorum]